MVYDVYLRSWSRAPPDDVVIVAIDQASLAQIGRWPWPRRVHAELIERLAAAGRPGDRARHRVHRACPHRPRGRRRSCPGDRPRRPGRAAGPARRARPRRPADRGPAHSTSWRRPRPRLGHVEVVPDADGIVRRNYLRAGLGSPYWPSLALGVGGARAPGGRDPRPGPERRRHGAPVLALRLGPRPRDAGAVRRAVGNLSPAVGRQAAGGRRRTRRAPRPLRAGGSDRGRA